jgi:hypothetical protein
VRERTDLHHAVGRSTRIVSRHPRASSPWSPSNQSEPQEKVMSEAARCCSRARAHFKWPTGCCTTHACDVCRLSGVGSSRVSLVPRCVAGWRPLHYQLAELRRRLQCGVGLPPLLEARPLPRLVSTAPPIQLTSMSFVWCDRSVDGGVGRQPASNSNRRRVADEPHSARFPTASGDGSEDTRRRVAGFIVSHDRM